MKTKILKKMWGMKFGQRMCVIYLLGGLLPLVLISAYLIHGTNQILVEQAKNTEMIELEGIRNQIEEVQNTMITMSQYFYFDEHLEKISKKRYQDYQEMVDDYKKCTSFLEYRKYYNNLIARISMYVQNDTLKGNMNLVVVDEKIKQEEWYQKIGTKGNVVVWTYLPYVVYGHDKSLTLTRMIKTKEGEDVGVLAIYLRPERFEDMLFERQGTAFIVLNRETIISSKGDEIQYEQIASFLPEQKIEKWQNTICIDGNEYVMTVVNVNQQDTSDSIHVVSVRAVDDIIYEARQYNLRSIYLCCFSVALAVVVIGVSTYHFGKRIERFRLQMQKASKGNFEIDEKLGGNDEISELYDYLGIMIYDIQKLLASIYQERIHAERLKTKQKDAEFKMLTSQINPHFLYNTLETIRMKAVVNNQDEIEELVSGLAKILRSAIRAGEDSVTVQQEIELIENYLKIQKCRFGEKIQYHIEMDEALAEYEILSLIMQPIVENAIIHGLESKEDIGHIEIDVSRDMEDIVVTIEDDGIGITPGRLRQIKEEMYAKRLKGEHIGIVNVQYRLRLKYGEQYGVFIDSQEGNGTKVEIKIPAIRN